MSQNSFQITTASSFFPDNEIPSVLPSDSAEPDFNTLESHVSFLEKNTTHPLQKLKSILTREHNRLGIDTSLLDKIDNNTVFVVAGQQAGLFGGPLYTLYKALHTIKLAKRITESTGKTALPLFWAASDDHDVNEVSSLGIRSDDGSPQRVTYTPENTVPDGTPAGDIIIDGGISPAIETLAKSIPPGGRHDAYMEIIAQSWTQGTSWCDAFIRQLAHLTEQSILFFDPRWDDVKRLFLPYMRIELEDPMHSSKLVNEVAESMATAEGRRKAVQRPEGATNLFYESDGLRLLLEYDSDADTFSAGTETRKRVEWLSLLNENPERFSPAAVLRPICQDAVIPTAALIAGPGERHYLRQTAVLYDMFETIGAPVWPRASFTIVEPRVTRYAEKEDIDIRLLFDDPAHVRSELLLSDFPPEAAASFAEAHREVNDIFNRLTESIESIDPTLSGTAGKMSGKIHDLINGLKAKTEKAFKQSQSVSEQRITQASYSLRPDGHAQERWFGSDLIFSLFGADGIMEIADITSPEENKHRLLFP